MSSKSVKTIEIFSTFFYFFSLTLDLIQYYIFFINSEGDEFAKIKYDKYDSWCYIYYGLIDEISTFFSFDYNNSKELIGNWVENTLEMEVDGIQPITLGYLSVKDI